MGKTRQILLNFDLFPQPSENVETRTWQGVIGTLLCVAGAAVYMYFYISSALKDPFIVTQTTEQAIGSTLPVRIKCRTAECFASSQYTGYFGEQCVGGGLESGKMCEKMTNNQQETLKACYDPDISNGPKILFTWPTETNRPGKPTDWVGWEFGASVVVHRANEKTGDIEDIELPIRYGTTLLSLTVVQNNTLSGKDQTSYQFAPSTIDPDGSPVQQAAARDSATNNMPLPYLNPCLSSQRDGISIGPGMENQLREARLLIMPTYRLITIDRRDILTDVLGAVGGFFGLLTKIGAVFVAVSLIVTRFKTPVLVTADNIETHVSPRAAEATAKVAPAVQVDGESNA